MDVLPRFKRDTLIDGELDVRCTLPPIVHSTQSYRYPGEQDIFDQPCGNLGACPCGRQVPAGLSAPVRSICSPQKGPLLLEYRLDQLRNEATPQFTLVATSDSFALSFLFFLLFLTANYRFVMCLHCLSRHDQYSYIQASHVRTEELYTVLFLKLSHSYASLTNFLLCSSMQAA